MSAKITGTPGAIFLLNCGAIAHKAERNRDAYYPNSWRLTMARGCGGSHDYSCRAGEKWNYHSDGKWIDREHDEDFELHVKKEILP